MVEGEAQAEEEVEATAARVGAKVRMMMTMTVTHQPHLTTAETVSTTVRRKATMRLMRLTAPVIMT
jgi:hypothetical protein